MFYLPVYPDKHRVLVKFLLERLYLVCRMAFLRRCGGIVPDDGRQCPALAYQFYPPLFGRKDKCPVCDFLIMCVRIDLFLYVLHVMREFLIVRFHFGGHKKFLTQAVTLFFAESLERMKIGFVVFHYCLVDKHILDFSRSLVPSEYQEYQGFEKVLLLTEVKVVFLPGHLKRIHGDWLLLGVRYVCAAEISAYTLV